MQIRWLISSSASCLHATAALVAGRTLVDAELQTALAPSAQLWNGELAELGLSGSRLFGYLAPLSAGIENNTQLAEVALGKMLGSSRTPRLVQAVARLIAGSEAAFLNARPDAVDELQLRSDPLRGQWEARGPGLLAMTRRLVGDAFLVESADVILVHPVLGGGGMAHPLLNSVTLEAMLANPLASLPEVVRLGWLLAQLNLDLPILQGDLHRDRALELGAWALIPPVLMAAEEVDLARYDQPTLELALQSWPAAPISAPLLQDWWDTYHNSRPAWPVAMAALEAMLMEEGTEARDEG